MIRIELLARPVGRQESIDRRLIRNVHFLKRVREHEPIHANHDGDGHFLGNAEGLDVEIARFLIIFSKKLNPAAVALAPDIDRSADRAVGYCHHHGKPKPARVVDGLRHIKKTLAGRCRIGAAARHRGADCHRHRSELAFHIDVLAVGKHPFAAKETKIFNNVGLRRNRVGAHHVRPAKRDRLRYALAAFELLKHGSSPSGQLRIHMPDGQSRHSPQQSGRQT